uniref:Charged multivesicular body protein 3 n=1 Tax=Prasinoderma singulare TaxID=676789 RepID=A0A7S3BP32_9VIRI|mmetsp:Transcript_2025/g.5885  ORF Transcript_2025/g.5885 Transcript_2025/m.5885 type:complete len:221 (+) Transcript_2025:219-881(+)
MEKVKALFGGKKPNPKEQVRKWQSELRKEQRAVDRQIRDIERTRKSVEKDVRAAAKRGDTKSCRILAREMVRAKSTVARLYTNKANLNSVGLKLGEQLATVSAVGHLEKSASVMAAMSKLMNQGEMAKSLAEMSREMMKAGVIEEMVNDGIESALDEEDLEEEADAEVAKVLADVAGDMLKDLPGMESVASLVQAKEEPAAQQEEEEMDGLRERLAAVRT